MSVTANSTPQPVRSLDSNGDWMGGAGRLSYAYQTNAIQQNIVTRLNSFLGDCFFSVQDGINWLYYLSSKDPTGLNLAVSAVIMGTPGVSRLNQPVTIFLNRTTRELSIQYSVNVISYPLPVQGVVVVSNSSFILTESGSILTDESGDGIILE
jgi:hypothetical protein